MDVLDVIIKIWVGIYEMIPVGVAILTLFLFGAALSSVIIERRPAPWEKAEKKAAKKAAKEAEKARRDFWAGKRV